MANRTSKQEHDISLRMCHSYEGMAWLSGRGMAICTAVHTGKASRCDCQYLPVSGIFILFSLILVSGVVVVVVVIFFSNGL